MEACDGGSGRAAPRGANNIKATTGQNAEGGDSFGLSRRRRVGGVRVEPNLEIPASPTESTESVRDIISSEGGRAGGVDPSNITNVSLTRVPPYLASLPLPLLIGNQHGISLTWKEAQHFVSYVNIATFMIGRTVIIKHTADTME